MNDPTKIRIRSGAAPGPREASAREPNDSGGQPRSRENRCRRCGRSVDPSDRFCRQCGQRQGKADSWLYRPLWIIVLSLTVLGPFAIPLVQRSPYLSPAGKKIMNLAIVLYTVLVLIASAYLVLFFLKYFSDLSSTLDSGLF